MHPEASPTQRGQGKELVCHQTKGEKAQDRSGRELMSLEEAETWLTSTPFSGVGDAYGILQSSPSEVGASHQC